MGLGFMSRCNDGYRYGLVQETNRTDTRGIGAAVCFDHEESSRETDGRGVAVTDHQRQASDVTR